MKNKTVGELIKALKQFDENYEIIISDLEGNISDFDELIFEDNKKVVILTFPYSFFIPKKKIIKGGD